MTSDAGAGRPRLREPAHPPVFKRIGDFRLQKIGISRYDLRDPYYTAVTAPWGVFTAAVVTLVFVVNLVFAELYVMRPGAIENLKPGAFADAFFFSVETLSTVGYGAMSPVTLYGHVVATVEIIVGLGFTATLTGVLFVRLSKPRARILFADSATVNGEGEDAMLSVRVANGRQVLLTKAAATLGAVLTREDADGRTVWQTHHLPLEQDQVSLFPLTWTLEHRMAGSSPLKGFGPAEFRDNDVKLYLMVEAHDPAINADVQELREYTSAAVVFGRRYAQAISRDAGGRILADLARLGDLV